MRLPASDVSILSGPAHVLDASGELSFVRLLSRAPHLEAGYLDDGRSGDKALPNQKARALEPCLHQSTSGADGLDTPPLLEIDAALAAGGRENPTPHWATEKRSGLRQLGKAVLVDLGVVDGDRRQLLIAKGPAVEQEAHPAGSAGARPQEVDAGKPATLDLKAALLEGLAPASLPRGLADLLDLAARDRPARLVVGLQDQQPPGLIEDQRAG